MTDKSEHGKSYKDCNVSDFIAPEKLTFVALCHFNRFPKRDWNRSVSAWSGGGRAVWRIREIENSCRCSR